MRSCKSAKSEGQITLWLFFFLRFCFRLRCNFMQRQSGFVEARNFAKAFERGGIFRLKVDETHAAAPRA